MMSTFTDRIIRAARLDVALYEEVEADRGALGQAMGVVVLSSIAVSVGALGSFGIGEMIIGIIGSLIGWFVWAYLTYFIGTRLLAEPQTRADHGELLRTIGFSSAPGILMIVGIIPGIAGILYMVTSVWMLIAMVIAVRQALDYTSTARAVGVCIIGWIVRAVFVGVLYTLI